MHQLDRVDTWNKKGGGGIELYMTTSPDNGVGGEYIDTDERASPMRELPEKIVDNVKGLKLEKNTGIAKRDEEALPITTAALKKLAGEHRDNE
jgi:hypothetical protein